MKKKIIAVLIIALVCSVSVFAAPKSKKANYRRGKDMGIGLNLGYPGLGLAFRYHNDDLRILGAAAFDYKYGAIAIDATGEYIFATLEDSKKRPIMDFSLGAGAGVGIPTDGESLYLAFELGIIANYDIADTPFSLFVRGLWRPYLTFGDDGKFEPVGFGASAGFTYNIDLD